MVQHSPSHSTEHSIIKVSRESDLTYQNYRWTQGPSCLYLKRTQMFNQPFFLATLFHQHVMKKLSQRLPWWMKMNYKFSGWQMSSMLSRDDDQANMAIPWSAYFANLQPSVPKPPAITALLPMFRDNAHSPAMVKHGMGSIKQITSRVNQNQIPVLTVDQPLYAIAKKIQWAWPDE